MAKGRGDLFQVRYLTMLCSFDDRTINECSAVGGMNTENEEVPAEHVHQYHPVHYKSHTT
jgi:hypothetical protein